MSAAKHTPGPWEARIPFSTAARHTAYIVGRERILAAVTVPGVTYEDLRTAHENARLIAAAPELLAALLAIVEEAGPRMGLDDTPGSINTMSRIARAAIAKTAGGAG